MFRLNVAAVWLALTAASLAQVREPFFGRGVWRGNLVDFRIVNGWAIVEGDIIAGRPAELAGRYQALLEAKTPDAKDRMRQALAVADQARLWPDGVVPYEIDPELRDTSQIEAAVKYWNEKTAVRVVPRNGEENYVRIEPYEDPTACASSSVGMRGGMQLLFASETCGAAILVHELGHVVGLSHEHARSDRDRYVRLLWENLTKPGLSQYGVSVPSTDTGSYDYYSIMHYRGGDLSKNGQLTMESKPAGIPMGQSLVLSDGDIDAVNRLYGKPPQTITIGSTPPGLELIVDGESITAPRAFEWAPGTTHTVEAPAAQEDANGRYHFARWSDSGERAHSITANPETATLYTANFVRFNRFNLRVTPEDGGTVRLSPASPDGTYRDDTRVTFTAVPNPGYVFANWAGPFIEHNRNLTNLPVNPVSFYVDGDFQGFTARFVPEPQPSAGSSARPVTRIVSVVDSGEIARAPVRVDGVLYGTPVSFTWEPGTLHDVEIAPMFPVGSDLSLRTFQKWNDGTDSVRKIVAGSEAATYTATYGIQYGLLPATVGSGRVELAPASSTYFYDRNSTVELIATGGEGNHFVGWGMDLGGNQSPRLVVMRESLLPIAFFGSTTAVSNFAAMNTARQRPNHEITGNSILAKISPGEVVTINAPGVGPDTPQDATPDASGAIGTRLAGLRVLVGTVAVPVLSVAKGQVTAFIPYGAAVLVKRSTSVQVEQDGAALRPGMVAVVAANPAIYTADGTGSGQAKVLNEDGSENGPGSPARKGAVISFLASGLGVTEPAGPEREVSANLGPAPKGELEARIGGAVAEVISAGIAPGTLGIHRIQARVPENARSGSASPLILTVDGAPSQVDVTVAVE